MSHFSLCEENLEREKTTTGDSSFRIWPEGCKCYLAALSLLCLRKERIVGRGLCNGSKRDERILIQWYCISIAGQDRQKHTTNHQRAERVIWIVRLLCTVVHPKALCGWIWLEDSTKKVVCPCAFICRNPLMYGETLAGVSLADNCRRNPTPLYYP